MLIYEDSGSTPSRAIRNFSVKNSEPALTTTTARLEAVFMNVSAHIRLTVQDSAQQYVVWYGGPQAFWDHSKLLTPHNSKLLTLVKASAAIRDVRTPSQARYQIQLPCTPRSRGYEIVLGVIKWTIGAQLVPQRLCSLWGRGSWLVTVRPRSPFVIRLYGREVYL
jgi:hypothetical protein